MAAAASANLRTQPGVLITSDEATIVYLLWLDERGAGGAGGGGGSRAIIRQLDTQRVFVRAHRLAWVRPRPAERLEETSYEAGATAAAAAAAGRSGGGGDE